MPADTASAEVRACARAYRELLACAVALAACELSLRRLTREYVRTERRTRAIENILLPEIDAAVRLVEELLDGMDQEEFARLRHHRAAHGGGVGPGEAQRVSQIGQDRELLELRADVQPRLIAELVHRVEELGHHQQPAVHARVGELYAARREAKGAEQAHCGQLGRHTHPEGTAVFAGDVGVRQ